MMYKVYFQCTDECPKDFLAEFPTLEEAQKYKADSIEGEGWEPDEPEGEEYIIEGPEA